MKLMNRINGMGMQYRLVQIDETTTEIRTGNKKITVNVHIDELSQMWFNWNMRGEKVQVAFSKLTPSEREFIMTGITDEEWSELFPENKDEREEELKDIARNPDPRD